MKTVATTVCTQNGYYYTYTLDMYGNLQQLTHDPSGSKAFCGSGEPRKSS